MKAVSIKNPCNKMPFRVFDKLKNGIQNFVLRFGFYFNMKNEFHITDYCFHV